MLQETDTDASRVTLEMTESVFMEDDERALMVLKELKRMGVCRARRLRDGLLIDTISDVASRRHEDGSGVHRELAGDPTSRAIVSALVDLAHSLDMEVVAEGVETTQQYNQVRGLHCDAYQGFHFLRPAPPEQLETLMDSAL